MKRTDNRGRDIHFIDLKFNSIEVEIIEQKIKESGLTRGAYIRKASLNYPIIRKDDVIAELKILTTKIDSLIYLLMKEEKSTINSEKISEVLEMLWQIVGKLNSDDIKL